MDPILTIAEIATQFPGEWILIEDPETDASLAVERGKVICHSKDRDEVYRRAVSLRPKRFSIVYTGTLPHDAAVVL